jgi:hypothetical protein
MHNPSLAFAQFSYFSKNREMTAIMQEAKGIAILTAITEQK